LEGSVKRQVPKKTKQIRKQAAKKAPSKAVKKAKKAPPRPKAGDVLAGLSQYPEVMRPEEVQEVLRISRATFFRMIEAGKLKGAVRVGGSWRVLRDRLRQYLLGSAT
jgi:excisionase family DNA binding protein